MVFKRRIKRTTAQVIRDAVYPRKGWRRAFEYVGHRLKRLPDTPHKIALGLTCGVFVSFSPLFGFHFIYAAICALLLRGSVLAGLLGTFFGNPLTFPLIALVAYHTGIAMLGMPNLAEQYGGIMQALGFGLSALWESMVAWFGFATPRWGEVWDFVKAIFIPYFVGGVPTGIVAGLISYFVSRPIVAAYQRRRRMKLRAKSVERAKARPAASAAE